MYVLYMMYWQQDASTSFFVNNLPHDPCSYAVSVAWSYDPKLASLHAGIIKDVVSFYRIHSDTSDTAFERHRNRIPINDVNTVQAVKTC